MTERRRQERRSWNPNVTFPLVDNEGRLITHNRRRIVDIRMNDANARARLRLRHRWQDFTIDGMPFVLGRHRDCDLVIPDPLVSRHHLRIERRGDAFILVDESRNGTYVTFHGQSGGHHLLQDELPVSGPGVMRLARPLDNDPVNFKDVIYFDLG